MDEVFLEWPKDGRYLISNHGRCYSTAARKFIKPKGRDPWNGRGQPNRKYQVFWVSHRHIPVAATVLELFVGPRPGRNHVARHRDGDAENCRVDNLYWGLRFTMEQMKRFADRPRDEKGHFAR